MSIEQRKIVCYHEVGHAAISEILGIGKLVHIRICPDTASPGESSYTGGAYIKNTEEHPNLWNQGLLILAGAISELKYRERDDEIEQWESNENYGGDRDKFNKIAKDILLLPDYHAITEEDLFAKMWNECKNIILNHWNKIEKIALELYETEQNPSDYYCSKMTAENVRILLYSD
ncbi:hypothetical protein EHQ86_00345 [Leptospira yasudae]|nr:hypothetical protein EHQ86_00345 [Leptospira yasudae]